MNTSGLFCQYCGELNEADAHYCKKCGAVQPQAAGSQGQAAAAQSAPQMQPTAMSTTFPPPTSATVPPGAAYGAPPVFGPTPPPYAQGFRGYAGFWIRFLAVIIDAIVLGIVIGPIMFIIMGPAIATVARTAQQNPGQPPDPAAMMAFMSVMPLAVFANLAIQWVYEAALTSSSKQGTLGKMALGLKVTDKEGRRLSFLHATGRHFAKLINGFTLGIGWILAGFTERKQGLHDMIAGTYVIKS